MTIAIMQPYFLPYIGYWQLVNAVDKFVVFDDVNYIKRGWINRNRILVNNKASYITIPLDGASQNRLIKDINISPSNWKEKLSKTLIMNYKKAPQFSLAYPCLEQIINSDEDDLTGFLVKSLQSILTYLEIDKEIILSSEIEYERTGIGSDKVLSICKNLNADKYINLSGGQDLYNRHDFSEHAIELSFVENRQIRYDQFDSEFVANLSIVDMMMFCSKASIRHYLTEFNEI